MRKNLLSESRLWKPGGTDLGFLAGGYWLMDCTVQWRTMEYCEVCSVQCSVCNVQCAVLCSVQCSAVQFAICSVQCCAVWNMQCEVLCSVQCSVVQCTVCSVQFAVQQGLGGEDCQPVQWLDLACWQQWWRSGRPSWAESSGSCKSRRPGGRLSRRSARRQARRWRRGGWGIGLARSSDKCNKCKYASHTWNTFNNRNPLADTRVLSFC